MASAVAPNWLASSLVAMLVPPEGPWGAADAFPSPGSASAQVLAPVLLQANVLPSRLAHPLWLEAWADLASGLWGRVLEALLRLGAQGSPVNGEAILHRHVSAAMLRDQSLDLGWIDGPTDPALPLCLAPPPLFSSVLRAAGLVLVGPSIRQVIVRSDLARIEQQMGAESMEFVRRAAPRLWAGDGQGPRVQADALETQVEQWGCALLAHAFSAGEGPVARRGRLRLPPAAVVAGEKANEVPLKPLESAGMGIHALPGTLSDPLQALALCRALIQERDAQWLSHFPALR